MGKMPYDRVKLVRQSGRPTLFQSKLLIILCFLLKNENFCEEKLSPNCLNHVLLYFED